MQPGVSVCREQCGRSCSGLRLAKERVLGEPWPSFLEQDGARAFKFCEHKQTVDSRNMHSCAPTYHLAHHFTALHPAGPTVRTVLEVVC